MSYDKSWPEKVAETPLTGQANVNQEVPTNIIQFESPCQITTMDMSFQNQLQKKGQHEHVQTFVAIGKPATSRSRQQSTAHYKQYISVMYLHDSKPITIP